MKILIATVAGQSSRFSRSIGRPCLKCIYYEKDIRESLLYRMLEGNPQADLCVIVGGFRFDELKEVLGRDFGEFRDKILLVENEKYKEYGSGYSLYLGLKAIKDMEFEEVVFAEGDLWVERESFQMIWEAGKDVVTCSREPVLADKSAAFYYDSDYHIHYIFDTSHSMLEINEPFRGIFNSGQIWKFARHDRVIDVMESFSIEEWSQTNLIFVQKYFEGIDREGYEMIVFSKWMNCNTVGDFESIKDEEKPQ